MHLLLLLPLLLLLLPRVLVEEWVQAMEEAGVEVEPEVLARVTDSIDTNGSVSKADLVNLTRYV